MFCFSKFLRNLLSQSLNFYEIFCLFLPARPQPPNQLFWTKCLSCPLGARKIKPTPPCWHFVIQKSVDTRIQIWSILSLSHMQNQNIFNVTFPPPLFFPLQTSPTPFSSPACLSAMCSSTINNFFWLTKTFPPSNFKRHGKRLKVRQEF